MGNLFIGDGDPVGAAWGTSRTDQITALHRAVQYHHCGALDAAERLYREVLDVESDNSEALHLLGAVTLQKGDIEVGVALIRKSLKLNANSAVALSNIVLGLLSQGLFSEALAASEQALFLRPNVPEALNNRGNALAATGRFAEAVVHYNMALQQRPAFALALHNRGIALQRLQKYSEALADYDTSVQAGSADAGVWSNRGSALLRLSRLDEALVSVDQAIAMQRDLFEAHDCRGHVLRRMRRVHEAIDSFRRALDLKPQSAEAALNVGRALHVVGRVAEALSMYDLVIQLRPNHIQALECRASARRMLGRYEDAAADLNEILRLSSDPSIAFWTRLVFQLQCCDWRAHSAARRRAVADVALETEGTDPFYFLSISASPSSNLACAKRAVAALPPARQQLWRGERYSHGRIRVVYISAAFYSHATALLTRGLFKAHNADQFEIIAISTGRIRPEDPLQRQLRLVFSRFIDVHERKDSDVARLIREMEVDILVDLDGWTEGSRLGVLAYRPAPIQVTYLGYPGSTGADFVDYILADKYVIPPDESQYFAENVVYLPNCYQVNDSNREPVLSSPDRLQMGLPARGFVFCCFNNNYKFSPEIFSIWMRILHQVPNSVLWLHVRNSIATRNLQLFATQHGINPDRLVFAPPLPYRQHMARYCAADLFLDTLPYNAHTTASDALWAGLPLLTCVGHTFPGRVAASMLRCFELEELVTLSLEEYATRAVALATTPSLMALVRDKLRRQRATAPLFDTDRFCAHLESAYREMWRLYQHNQAAIGFTVPEHTCP